MFRPFSWAPSLLALALMPCVLRADTAEETWKNLVMQALHAAGANDLPKAEQMFLKAVKEAERFGPDDARVGTTLNSLGLVYRGQKKFSEAESVYRRAENVLEKAYGEDSLDVANVDYNIAGALMDQDRHPAALPYLQKTLAIYERQFGLTSLKTASVLCMMGDTYRLLKDFRAAEPPLKRCAQIREQDGGMLNKDLGEALSSLALVYQKQGKYGLADPVFKLAEKIREKTLGIMSPAFAETLEAHASMLKEMGRDIEAGKDAALAAAIRRNLEKRAAKN